MNQPICTYAKQNDCANCDVDDGYYYDKFGVVGTDVCPHCTCKQCKHFLPGKELCANIWIRSNWNCRDFEPTN